jgi:small subunit ribosomal protein S3
VGRKVNPIGFRLGIYRGWDARWFAPKKNYANLLAEDLKLRALLDKHFENAETSRVEIEKTTGSLRLIVHSARPGAIIGKRGQEIDSLRNQINSMTKRTNIEVSVQEIRKPELDALLIAKRIAAQLLKRESYKKLMGRAALVSIKSGAKGVMIACSGRLNGAEIARVEKVRLGSYPLQTLRSDVDYGFAEAKTTYGVTGVKVWLCKGDYQQKQPKV